eukprot:6176079-Pleurochrysis_carterae.AAC.3
MLGFLERRRACEDKPEIKEEAALDTASGREQKHKKEACMKERSEGRLSALLHCTGERDRSEKKDVEIHDLDIWHEKCPKQKALVIAQRRSLAQ